ncbi:DUF222 domain-containing protein [Mycolicibacterium vaccae]|uniref:HNH endonuclease signature motif containing protein n=1 Tax=Mycolicibacterium vaccae TaxID=1810 RepID=UPI003CFE16C3
MFDTMFAGLGQAELVAVIEQAGRDEIAASARRLAAIAELVHVTVEEDDQRGGWVYDCWTNTAAMVGAAMTIGQRRASGQMHIAVALRDRLPRIAALYCQGLLSPRLVSELTWRTRLVEDHDVLAVIDAALARKATTWGAHSEAALTRAIESVIERYDPDAVRRAKAITRGRDVRIGACDDPNEIATVVAQLFAQDAAALQARITELVSGLCPDDPRSAGDRRSDALAAITHRTEHLSCRCGSQDCPATAPQKSSVLIRVIADQAAITAAQHLIEREDIEHAQKRTAHTKPQTDAAPPTEPAQPVTAQHDSGTALLPGAKILPIAALAEAIRAGARIKPFRMPGPDPEPHYTPSARLAEYVRARDQFCRHPGCTVPAEHCDIDHIVAWPYGPTHPSNLACKCRTHHLGKTFWHGWTDTQKPDGTITLTTPIGHTYTTAPSAPLFFPNFPTTTAELPPMAKPPPPEPARILKMPRRRRTRAADNTARIHAERAHNAAERQLAQQRARELQQLRANRQQARDPDPPPF